MHPLARIDEIVLDHGESVVILRPTLRAAIILERLHGGWPALVKKLEEIDLATIRQVIRSTSTDRTAAEALLRSFRDVPLLPIAKAVSEPLGELVGLFFAPIAETTTDDDQVTTAPRPWSEVYADLFKIGTGWLGWTPAETWAATLPEIHHALEGFTARHAAMNGTGDEKADTSTAYTPERLEEIDRLGHDPAFDREGLRALKARHSA